MKFNYNLSKKNYEKIVRKTNSKNNIYYVIGGSLIYLFFIRNLIMDNFVLMLCLYLISTLVIYFSVRFVTFLTSKLIVKINEKGLGVKYGTYECTLNKDKFVEKINGAEISIQIKDITKVKQTENNYEVLTNKMIIIFNRGLFEKSEDFDKVVDFINKNKPSNKKEV